MSDRMPDRMSGYIYISDVMPDRMSDRRSNKIPCQTECQIECQDVYILHIYIYYR